MTDEELNEIEARYKRYSGLAPTDAQALVAEIRRLRAVLDDAQKPASLTPADLHMSIYALSVENFAAAVENDTAAAGLVDE
jgi:hypothetical protein